VKLRIYGSQGMSWGDTSFVGLVLESTSGTIAKLIYFGADAKQQKKHGRYCCELYFSIYFHLWRTKKSDQCMDAPGAECWALGPWPINLGSLGSLQPWEHHEYLRPGTPGIGRNHPEC
jgi:hypothetical protein